MNTSDSGIEAEYNSLHAQANTWDQAAEQMRQVAANVADLHLDYLQAGVFFILVNAYDSVVTKVTNLCGGQHSATTEMRAIANGLRYSADSYREAEIRNIIATKNINHD